MATATMCVTVEGAGNKDGTDWTNAFGLAEFITDVINNAEADDLYYVYSGTYTFTGSLISGKDGTTVAPIRIIGVSDQEATPTEAQGGDRPLFDLVASYEISLDNYWEIYNIRFNECGGSYGVRLDTCGLFRNCYSFSTNKLAFYLYGFNNRLINCEAESTNAQGVYFRNQGVAIGCYVHDSTVGIQGLYKMEAFNCIVDTCSEAGFKLGGQSGGLICNNIAYNCGIGINSSVGYGCVILNNIIDSCTTGASWDTEQKTNLFDYNNWYNNTADVNNVTKGSHAQALDPQFTDAPNGDFSIGTNLKGLGFPGKFPGELSTGYLDTGAVQREEKGGGLMVNRYNRIK